MKKGRLSRKIFLSLLCLVISVIAVFIAIKVSNNTRENDISQNNDVFSNISTPHWTHMPLTYFFAEPNTTSFFIGSRELFNYQCLDYQIKRFEDALNIIQNSTDNLVSFKGGNQSSDIIVYCYRLKSEGGYYTQGEAISDFDENRLKNGTLNFYDSLNCGSWPDVEIHEVLHLFYYDHIDKWDSIMTPIAKTCDLGKIDDNIISCLKYTYSNGKEGGGCFDIKFMDPSGCEEGWFEVEGTNLCCPEPGMIVVDDECIYPIQA